MGILRDQKTIIALDSFSNLCLLYLSHLDISSLFIDYPIEGCKKYSNSLWLHVAGYYSVTEEA